MDNLFGESAESFRASFPEAVVHHAGPLERLARRKVLPGLSLTDLLGKKCAFVQAHGRLVGEPNKSNIIDVSDRSLIKPLYDTGWTIYFHSIWDEQMEGVLEEISKELGVPSGGTRMSAWASKHGPGVPVHFDGNDNIVIQAVGTKSWSYAANHSVKHPTVGHVWGHKITPGSFQARETPEVWLDVHANEWKKVDLVPGDVIFMPRGVWHTVSTVTDESLHFNIQTGVPTFVNLVTHTLQRLPLNNREPLRAGLLNAFDARTGRMRPEVKEDLLKKIRQVLDEELEAVVDGITEEGLSEFLGRTRSKFKKFYYC